MSVIAQECQSPFKLVQKLEKQPCWERMQVLSTGPSEIPATPSLLKGKSTVLQTLQIFT